MREPGASKPQGGEYQAAYATYVLQRVGDSWQTGGIRIAHEHMATAVIRIFLGELLQGARLPASAPEMVVTTPVGRVYELGALLAALVAVSAGSRAAYLGADLPAEEVAAAASLTRIRAVALGLVYPAADPAVAQEIVRLRRYLADAVPILLGGRVAAS